MNRPHARYHYPRKGRSALAWVAIALLALLAAFSVVAPKDGGSLACGLPFFWSVLGAFGFVTMLARALRLAIGGE